MSLVLYGVAEASAAPVSGVGLDDRPLHAVVEGPLAAIVSDHPSAGPEPATERLRDYELTMRRLMERDAILPARFGSVLADEGAARALLRRRHRDLLSRVRRVRGAVELALRASWRRGAQGTPGDRSPSGTSYLRERLELRQSARRVASELDPLSALALSSLRTVSPEPDLPVLDAYLVERDRVGEFVALVRQLDDDLDDVDLTCTGPWPPYSFAEGAPV